MSVSPTPADQVKEEYQANRAEAVASALKKAKELGRPFVFEWRPSANTQRSYAENDVGCGCGPAD
jgi:sugar/nucleoside kinase (ribokinase family)